MEKCGVDFYLHPRITRMCAKGRFKGEFYQGHIRMGIPHDFYLYYPKTNLLGFFQSAAATVNVIKEPIDVYKIAKAINSVRTL